MTWVQWYDGSKASDVLTRAFAALENATPGNSADFTDDLIVGLRALKVPALDPATIAALAAAYDALAAE